MTKAILKLKGWKMFEKILTSMKKMLDNPSAVIYGEPIEATIRKGAEWATLTDNGHIISYLDGDDVPVVSEYVYSFDVFLDECRLWGLVV